MWVFPMAAAVVAGIFTALITQEWIAKRKPHELAWAIAFLMFAIASFAASMGMLAGWSAFGYRVFFLFGAVINVPVLALGTFYLLGPRKVAHAAALVVAAAALFSAGAVWYAHLETSQLAVEGLVPKSRLVLPDSTLVLARYMSFAGFFVVVAGALWSAWRLARRGGEMMRRLAMANILIAVGTSIVAGASGFIAIGTSLGSALFAVGLLAGISVIFAGFLRTRARAVPAPEPPAEDT